MANEGFTSGPWAIEGPNAAGVLYVMADDVVVAEIDNFAGEGEDDAVLISAAPDLYAALDELIELARPNIYPQPDKPDSPYAKLERARIAMLKARGEQVSA